jgi:hypothetical protein
MFLPHIAVVIPRGTRSERREVGKFFAISFSFLLIVLAFFATVNGQEKAKQHRESHDYVARRQQAGQVEGTPAIRRYRSGGREIDIYRNGLMYEKDNVVGVKPR